MVDRPDDPDAAALYEQLAELDNRLVAMQRELARKNAELTRLLEDRAEIAAMAAHDLRTPLQVISLAAETLNKSIAARLDAAAAQAARTVSRSAEKMAVLVNDLLEAYRADIGKLEVALEPVELGPLVQANAESNRTLAEQKGVALTCAVGELAPRVLADALRLHQVLDNLLTNAIRLSSPGSRVRVALHTDRDDAVITVEDEGPGIEAAQLEALLRGSPGDGSSVAASGRGYGLGFAIIRTILDKHGGAIEGDARPGRGVAFRIRLPVAGPETA